MDAHAATLWCEGCPTPVGSPGTSGCLYELCGPSSTDGGCSKLLHAPAPGHADLPVHRRAPQHCVSSSQVMGYVPQDDVMLADMTVEELLLFSARVRLPAAARPADHLRHVDRTINARLYCSFVTKRLVGQVAQGWGSRGRAGTQCMLTSDMGLLTRMGLWQWHHTFVPTRFEAAARVF